MGAMVGGHINEVGAKVDPLRESREKAYQYYGAKEGFEPKKFHAFLAAEWINQGGRMNEGTRSQEPAALAFGAGFAATKVLDASV